MSTVPDDVKAYVDDAVKGPNIGLAVLGVILVIVIVLAAVVIYLLYRKLLQHEEEINKLSDPESGLRRPTSKFANSTQMTDSAIELSDVELDRNGHDAPRPISSVSTFRMTRPQFTIKIRKETANVYGQKPIVSQMMAVAQKDHCARTNSGKLVAAETMDIRSTENGRKVRFSKVLNDDLTVGRPTSVLFDTDVSTSIKELQSYSQGIFVHKVIDASGGFLEISGVSLTIPANALEKSVTISLGIMWDDKLAPTLTKQQSILTPIILCQPCGLKFKTPVELKLPHCAVDITGSWVPKIMKREGRINSENTWTNITLDDYEERNVSEHNISLKVHHFTLYACVGESKPGKVAAKAVKLLAFAPPLEKGGLFRTRIYCINDYKDIEVVETFEKKQLSGRPADAPVPVFIKDNGKNLVVEMAKLSEGWKLDGKKYEEIPFEAIWHALSPHCSFIFKPEKQSPTEIFCEFLSHQKDSDEESGRLKIAEKLPKLRSPLSSIENDNHGDVVNMLILHLDPKSAPGSDAGDWCSLAEKMGLSKTKITWLETQTSPTETLVQKWEDDGHSFEDLHDVLVEINRPDVAEELEKLLYP